MVFAVLALKFVRHKVPVPDKFPFATPRQQQTVPGGAAPQPRLT
jgi:hypothetical protein